MGHYIVINVNKQNRFNLVRNGFVYIFEFLFRDRFRNVSQIKLNQYEGEKAYCHTIINLVIFLISVTFFLEELNIKLIKKGK
jgi:hypothetical protein